jgi:hypothetical protein
MIKRRRARFRAWMPALALAASATACSFAASDAPVPADEVYLETPNEIVE